eukprot:jgi/Mesen1/1364/ME000013S00859
MSQIAVELQGEPPGEVSETDTNDSFHSTHEQRSNDDLASASPPTPGNVAGGAEMAAGVAYGRRQNRCWPRDLIWLAAFLAHLAVVGYMCVHLGRRRWAAARHDETEDFWPMYATGAAIGAFLSWAWLYALVARTAAMVKVAVHGVCTYLAVIAVFCFWDKEYIWGIAFAVGALLQFLYAMAVMDRLGLTMLVILKSVAIIKKFRSLLWLNAALTAVLLAWMALWSLGVAGVVALDKRERSQWWVILLLSLSLLWTGAVFCNMVSVVVAGVISEWLSATGAEGAPPRPKHPTLQALAFALMSLGSICYGSLLTAAIRFVRWAVRGLRARCGHNECAMCCVDILFNGVEIGVRFFNKYGFVMVGMTVAIIQSTVTAVYVVFAADPTLIGRIDPEFSAQLVEINHSRLQHRSGKSVEGANISAAGGLPSILPKS